MSELTKKALAQSLKNLMKETSLDKITIKDITINCGVNRQTFYYHFKDIYNLVEWIYDVEAVESIKKYRSYNTWQQGFKMICEYIKNNLDFSINCIHSKGKYILEKILYNITFDLIIGVVKEISLGKNINIKEQNFIADFYTYAFIGSIMQWIKNGAIEKPEDMINLINLLIDGNIKRVINKRN